MNPQQDYLGPNQNPYDFIMNPAKPPKKHSFGLDPFIIKILLVLAAIFGLMVIVAVALNLTASKKTSDADLIALAQTQQELIRVANAGSGAVQQATKNLAITTEFTLRTQQTGLLEYLGKHGVKLKGKELDLKQNATTDLKLKQAKETSTFDTTFSQILEDELRAYASTSQRLFNNTGNATQKNFLSNYYSQTQDLISQVPYTRSTIEDAQ